MDLLRDVRRIVDYFKRREEVSALYIFGSAATGKHMAESDLDIAVLLDDRGKGRKTYEALRETYYAASPEFSMRPVDIVILNTAPSFLKHHIIKSGKVLIDRNRRRRVRFVANAIIEYLDYKPIEDLFIKAVTHRFRRSGIGG